MQLGIGMRNLCIYYSAGISLIQARKRSVCIVCHYLSKKGEVTNIHTYLGCFSKKEILNDIYFLKGYLAEERDNRVEGLETEARHL